MSRRGWAWLVLAGLAFGESASTAEPAACAGEQLRFLGAQCARWQSQVLPMSLPPAKGNALADNEPAAALGMRVFYDNRFSQRGSGISCANCHDPEYYFAERKRTSHTINEIARNAPELINVAWYTRAHFRDGRVDNLWSAPLFTFEQADEMGATRLGVVRALAAVYKMRYEKIFGAMPDFSDVKRFPLAGKPGMPEYDAMSAADKDLVNGVYANIGKALEAYMRKLAAGRAPFDDFMLGYPTLKADAQRGMVAFDRHGCGNCHSGPAFTDEGYHNLGYPAKAGRPPDPGRAGGLTLAGTWPFSSTGKFADPAKGNLTVAAPRIADDLAGFRTPSLRNVALTAPYGHDGAFDTLDQVIDAHARVLPGGKAPEAQDKQDIILFLRALSGRPPMPPWNYWPGG